MSPRERGKGSSGCLLSLLILIAIVYYGVHIAPVFFRYYQLLDKMESEARLAAGLEDATIRRRIEQEIQEIGLPDSAGRRLIVRRTASPRQIVIETRYSESVSLPLFHHTFTFNPRATQPL